MFAALLPGAIGIQASLEEAVRLARQAGFAGLGLSLGEAFEAQPFERGILGVPDAALHLAFSIRVADAAGQRDGAVVGQQVAIERVEKGIVDIGLQHAFAEVIQDDGVGGSTEAAESSFVKLGPGAHAGFERQ